MHVTLSTYFNPNHDLFPNLNHVVFISKPKFLNPLNQVALAPQHNQTVKVS